MTTTPVRLLLAALACTVLAAASPAQAASKKKTLYPTISKISPTKLGIGDTMTISGKNFRKGKNKNTVVFKRDGGRAIFVRVAKTTSTKKLSVKVPAKLLPFLAQKKGVAQYTRFRIRVLAARFGKAFTALKRSPRIGPVAIGPKVSKSDCDGDGIENAKDADDDNDLLSDSVETNIGTNTCARDTDGDGMSDGWEYQSALDRNNGRSAGATPSPNRKPYANPLDKADGPLDQDGDGLDNLMEYAAWATFSNEFRNAPAGGSVLTYSGGNPASDGRASVPATLAYADRDKNNFLSDFERDADGDGFPNMDEGLGTHELVRIGSLKAEGDDPRYYDFGLFSQLYIDKATTNSKQDAAGLRCGGINQVPFYCVDQAQPTAVTVQKVDPLDWLARDTDGDGIGDADDDQDHDGVGNFAEYLTELTAAPANRSYQQLDACIPNTDSYFCILAGLDIDGDGLLNNVDLDDDGDLLPDTVERQIHTDPLLADTDGDGVSDAFEYYSALDLNSAALPYPGKSPYPNPLDGEDGGKDFDQDVLTLREEYKAWRFTGSPLPLSYSDGTKYSGGSTPVTAQTADLDLDGNGVLSDDEKDVDADGLTNFDETHGRMTAVWWDLTYGPTTDFKESAYPGPVYPEPSFVDADSDGDGLKDGADDQDHDGFPNTQELARPLDWLSTYVSTAHNAGLPPGSNTRARVNPFNPCKPFYSDYCHVHFPLGYYPKDEDWASPIYANGP